MNNDCWTLRVPPNTTPWSSHPGGRWGRKQFRRIQNPWKVKNHYLSILAPPHLSLSVRPCTCMFIGCHNFKFTSNVPIEAFSYKCKIKKVVHHHTICYSRMDFEAPPLTPFLAAVHAYVQPLPSLHIKVHHFCTWNMLDTCMVLDLRICQLRHRNEGPYLSILI